MTLGSVAGGSIMKIGRRRTLFLSNLCGAIGFAMCFKLNFPVWLCGRFLSGISAGLFSSVTPRLLEETTPKDLFDRICPLFVFVQCCGMFIAISWGSIQPPASDPEALRTTTTWRVPCCYFPLALHALYFLGQVFIVRHDSIKFLAQKGNEREAKQVIKLLYKHAKDDAKQQAILNKLKKNYGSDSSGLTLVDALVDPRYRRATWVNVGCMVFHELTGINVIMLYSSQMLAEMHKSGKGLSPRAGTYLIGAVNALSSLLSIVTVKTFPRKPLVVAGHFLIGLSYLLLAIFNSYQMNDLALAMLLFFLLFYENTTGPVAWLYAAETTIDAALGFILLSLWGTVLLLSFVSPNLMDAGSLGPTNTFYLYAFFQFLGSAYNLVFMKETRGLSDKEKKTLFTPAEYKAVQNAEESTGSTTGN